MRACVTHASASRLTLSGEKDDVQFRRLLPPSRLLYLPAAAAFSPKLLCFFDLSLFFRRLFERRNGVLSFVELVFCVTEYPRGKTH